MFTHILKTSERFLNHFFPSKWNPLYNLGTLSFYLFFIVLATGIYLFIFFETSVVHAYESVESITHEQFYIGSLIRSLHRYASSLMAVTVTLHLFRELILRRYVGARWFSWISGIPLLWLLFASAIGGYWLVWDTKAQYISLTTAALLDSLPIIVEPMAQGFVNNAAISDRFFSLLIFMHVGVPLALMLGMIIHIKRINNVRMIPSKGLAIGIVAALVILSILYPALSLQPADFDKPLKSVEIDWFYMNTYPLIQTLGPANVGLLLLGISGLLTIVPLISYFLEKKRLEPEQHIAVVDPEFCNGCGWCFADCPYEAIYMKPHDFRKNHEQAVVINDYCVGCGICAGACPSVTPFKNFNEANSGIDIPEFKMSDFLLESKKKTSQIKSKNKILVVGCHHGTNLLQFESEDTTTESLECIGQLPPSYMDFLCRREGIDAVLLTGCASGDCYHRSGIEIQEERLVRLREPHVKYADVREKIAKVWTGSGGEKEIAAKIAEIKTQLETKA